MNIDKNIKIREKINITIKSFTAFVTCKSTLYHYLYLYHYNGKGKDKDNDTKFYTFVTCSSPFIFIFITIKIKRKVKMQSFTTFVTCKSTCWGPWRQTPLETSQLSWKVLRLILKFNSERQTPHETSQVCWKVFGLIGKSKNVSICLSSPLHSMSNMWAPHIYNYFPELTSSYVSSSQLPAFISFKAFHLS